MDGNFKPYDHIASFGRVDEILAQPQGNFTEADSLPDRDKLTFTNGFYAYCTALFVDIRGSSKLPSHYKRPRLARIYRAFISETVAILNSDPYVREVNIVGDCVWAVYNTPRRTDLDDVFSLACRANILENVLNHKLAKAGYETPIYFGIGLSYGRALMIKAGYKGSTINDVIYMGDVVNQAAHLASRGGRSNTWSRTPRIHMDGVFRQNLNDHNQGLTRLVERYPAEVYSSDAVNTAMRDWLDEQRK
jgi:class 3 adenylate cyclase